MNLRALSNLHHLYASARDYVIISMRALTPTFKYRGDDLLRVTMQSILPNALTSPREQRYVASSVWISETPSRKSEVATHRLFEPTKLVFAILQLQPWRRHGFSVSPWCVDCAYVTTTMAKNTSDIASARLSLAQRFQRCLITRMRPLIPHPSHQNSTST